MVSSQQSVLKNFHPNFLRTSLKHWLPSVPLIFAFLVATISEGGEDLILKWIAVSTLWIIVLYRLKQPQHLIGLLKDKAFIGYGLFLIWAIFSSLFLSSAKSISILMLMPFIAGGLSYFIGFSNSVKHNHWFDIFSIILCVILALFTYYQKTILGLPRPYGLLSNWNAHAALLAMLILPWILRFTLQNQVHDFHFTLLNIAVFLTTFAIGLTLSRGVIIILFVALTGLVALALKQKRFNPHGLIILLALLGGFILSGLLFENGIGQRLTDIAKADSLTSLGSGRHLLWLPAWQMFLDNPITGWGLGTFRFLYMQYRPPLSQEAGSFAHNDYLQLLLELGPIGLVIFCIFVFLLLHRLVKILFYQSKINNNHESFIYLIISLGLLAHTFFTFHLYHVSIEILMGYYLGRSAKTTVSSVTNPQNFPHYPTLHKALSILVCLISLGFGLSLYFLNRADQAQNQQQKLDYFWKASLFFPALERYESYSAHVLTDHIVNSKTGGQLNHQQSQMASLALSEVNHAIQSMPFNTRNYMTKAKLLKILNQPSHLIIDQYQNALNNEPSSLGVRFEFSKFLIANQQPKQALDILWAAWNRLNVERYQTGIIYLSYHLQVNNQYGNRHNSHLIEQEIKRLKILQRIKEGGEFVFAKK